MDQNEANHFLTRVYRTQESKNVYIYIYFFFLLHCYKLTLDAHVYV